MLRETTQGVPKMSQTQTLIVDPKYLKAIPRPSENRYNQIKEDIEEHGHRSQ